ncbi:MAG: hypothetical protein M3O86_06240 [Actinomycetota bacterium]|nr:hypothetical protein [Actinomycetota bacterium]
MEAVGERSVSGRALIVVSLVVVALFMGAGVVLGPGLREQVRQETRPRTLREPIATGTVAGATWEAVARFDGAANCVELRLRAEVLGRACDAGAPAFTTTRLTDGGPGVAYGVTDEAARRVALDLDSGARLTAPVRAGELGFPVGFWATTLPAGATVVGAPAPYSGGQG